MITDPLDDILDRSAPATRAVPGDALAGMVAEARDAIARLDPDLAELVQLVHWERMTIVEAAELLGIPDSTARSRYARAKEALRVALAVPTPT